MTAPVGSRPDGRDPTRVVTRRCFALFVDAVLLALIPAVTVAIVGNASMSKGVCPDPLPAGRNCLSYRNQLVLIDKNVSLLFFGLLVVLYLLVFVAVQGVTGASPGKALLGIRVVRPDGTSPGIARSMVRAAGVGRRRPDAPAPGRALVGVVHPGSPPGGRLGRRHLRGAPNRRGRGEPGRRRAR